MHTIFFLHQLYLIILETHTLHTQNIVDTWYTGFNYPISLEQITYHLIKCMCRENGCKPKPTSQTCVSSAIAPPIEIYGPCNIFIVSNCSLYEDTTTSILALPSLQESQDPIDYDPHYSKFPRTWSMTHHPTNDGDPGTIMDMGQWILTHQIGTISINLLIRTVVEILSSSWHTLSQKTL